MPKASNVYRKAAIDVTDAEGIVPTLFIRTRTIPYTGFRVPKEQIHTL